MVHGKSTCVLVALMIGALGSLVAAEDIGKGTILFEWFDGTTGGSLDEFVDGRNANYPDNPSASEWRTSFDGPDGRGDAYGTRVRGYLYPPADGNYTFWIISDDHSRLWLSTDEDPANMALVCHVPGYSGATEWTKFPEQKSAAIPLKAGKKYYIEALHREGSGGDRLRVGWGGPAVIGAGPAVIEGKYLAPFIRDPEPFFLARSPIPADGEPGYYDMLPILKWTPGAGAVSQRVYLSPDAEITEQDLATPADIPGGQGGFVLYGSPLYTPGVAIWWRVDSVQADGSVLAGNVWTFRTSPVHAWGPSPVPGATYVSLNATLTWKQGFGALIHRVYLSADRDAVAAGADGALQTETTDTSFTANGLTVATTYYWRVDETDMSGIVTQGEVWSFTTIPVIDIADASLVGWWRLDGVNPTTAIDWSGQGNHGTLKNGPQWVDGVFGSALSLDGVDDYVDCGNPPVLDFGTNDWTVAAWVRLSNLSNAHVIFQKGGDDAGGHRYMLSEGEGNDHHITLTVDDNATKVEHKGAITVDNNEWHHVAGMRRGNNLYVYVDGVEDNGTTSVAAGYSLSGSSQANALIGCNWNQNTRATQKYFPGLIDDVQVYSKALTPEEIAAIMQHGHPVLARDPSPVDGAPVDIADAAALAWSAGSGAVKHDVYFAAEKDAIMTADTSSSAYMGRQDGTSFDLAGLVEFGGGDYFWRIDEVAANGAVVRGIVWDFIIPDYLVVDNFETYNEDYENLNSVYQHWIDGAGFTTPTQVVGNGTGSAVGHPTWDPASPYYGLTTVETRITLTDSDQSMPLYYDNSDPARKHYSEATYTLAGARDLTQGGMDTLQVNVHGQAVRFQQTPDTVTISAGGSDIWYQNDQFTFAYKTLNGNGSISARIDSLVNRDGWTKVGVMIRQSMDVASPFAAVYIAPDNGARYQARLQAGVDAVSDSSVATDEQKAINEPNWVKIERVGDAFNGYYSTNGTNWTPMVWNPQTIPMAGEVFIGLVANSHNVNAPTTAQFSDITVQGAPAGPFEFAEVATGYVHPINDPDTFFVKVQDSMNRSKTFTFDDVVTTFDWTALNIPFADFGNVNPAAVKKVSVGVGNPDAPQQAGSGVVFIDDILAIQAAPAPNAGQ